MSEPETIRVLSPWMNVKTAAAYLDFPPKRIYNLASTASIPCRRQEGRLLFHRDELDHWLNTYYVGPELLRPEGKEKP